MGSWIVAQSDGTVRAEPPVERGKRNVVSALAVEIVDRDKNPLPEIKFARMKDSLGDDGTLDPEKDNDRFYVRIPNGKSLGNVSLEVGTAENPDNAYNDKPTKITLIPDGDDLISKPLLLVSDAVDDNHDSADDAPEDQTHRSQLGGKFQVSSVTIDGEKHNIGSKFQIQKPKKVTFTVVVFQGPGQTTTKEDVELEIETVVRERFAQVGIWFDHHVVEKPWDPQYAKAHENSETDIHSPFFIRRFGNGALYIPWGARKLMDDHGTPTGEDLFVFVTPTLRRMDPDTLGIPLNGVGLHWSVDWPYLDVKYRNNAFLVGSNPGHWTLSHEVGHLYTDKGHYGQDYAHGEAPHKVGHNLMRAGVSSDTSITGPKRLYKSQDRQSE
jgi:hypothetical protein